MESAQTDITPYDAYKADPSPGNLSKVVDSLKPVIGYHLANLGVSDDPVMRNKARVVAAQAIQKYDPSVGVALPTYVSAQMPQLRRYRRKVHQILKVPERIQLDGWHLEQKEKEFIDQHDREPDLIELADFSKIPIHRIKKIREFARATPTEGAVGSEAASSEPDFEKEALDYVYRDADRIDRKILEWRTGYQDSPILQPLDIAAKLKVHPSQVSRRATRLTYKINQISQDLRDIST